MSIVFNHQAIAERLAELTGQKPTLRGKVFICLHHAKENGYFDDGEYLHNATSEEIACDMQGMSDDLGDYDYEDLIPHVDEWLRENKDVRTK